MKKFLLVLLLVSFNGFADPIDQINHCGDDAACVGKVLYRAIVSQRNDPSPNPGRANFRVHCECISRMGWYRLTRIVYDVDRGKTISSSEIDTFDLDDQRLCANRMRSDSLCKKY